MASCQTCETWASRWALGDKEAGGSESHCTQQRKTAVRQTDRRGRRQAETELDALLERHLIVCSHVWHVFGAEGVVGHVASMHSPVAVLETIVLL